MPASWRCCVASTAYRAVGELHFRDGRGRNLSSLQALPPPRSGLASPKIRRAARPARTAVGQLSSMPFKSKAQRRKFAELLVKGEISPETYEEWNRETGGKVLPERVKKKKKARKRKTARKGEKSTPSALEKNDI